MIVPEACRTRAHERFSAAARYVALYRTLAASAGGVNSGRYSA